MKINFNIKTNSGKMLSMVGNKHKITLSTNEVILVATTKANTFGFGKCWEVFDVMTGANIVSFAEKEKTEKDALTKAKEKIDNVLEEQSCFYKDIIRRFYGN